MKRTLSLVVSIIILITFTFTAMGLAVVPVKSIKLNTGNITIQINSTFNLKASVIPANTTQKLLKYSTANKSIATVDKYGKIKGIRPGKTVIIVTSASNLKVVTKCNVTIIKANDPAAKYAPVEGKKYKFRIAPYQRAPLDQNAKMVQYWQKKYGVEFNIWNIEVAKYTEIIGLKMASGEMPDLFTVGNNNNLFSWAEQGLLAEIPEDVLKKYSPRAYKYSIEASPNVYKLGSVNGKLYGLASIPVASASVRYNPAVLRGDWLEKVGITKIPESLKEYEEAFYKFVNNDPDGNGKKDTYGLSTSAIEFIYGAYGIGIKQWIEKDGKVVYGGIQPETKEVLSLLRKWYKDGVLDPEFITSENSGGYWALSHSFIKGRIGFTAHGGYGHWNPPLFEGDKGGANYQEIEKLNPTVAKKLVYAKPPVGPTGKSGSFVGGQSNLIIGNVVNCLGANLTKEPDRMGKLFSVLDDMNWSSIDSLYTALYGIKGEDWELQSNGTIKRIGEAAKDSLYIDRIGAGATFRFTGPEEFPGTTVPMIEWAKKNGFTAGLLKMATVPSIKQPAENKFKAELDKIQDEDFISIITGDKPLEYFNEFVAKWKKSGGDEMEKEVNIWYKGLWGK